MHNGDMLNWHTQRAFNREQLNQRKGGRGEDVGDQWVSERIKRYHTDAPENALATLRKTYENRTRIINHNCLDIYKPKNGHHRQQEHESLDNIYMLERSWVKSGGGQRRQTGLNIFKCFWPEAAGSDNNYHYVMKRIASMGAHVHVPHGNYLYVIYSDIPLTVVCGSCVVPKGHTSLIKGRFLWCGQPLPNDADIDYTRYSVLLAGELFFEQGKLIRWNNRSGHYRPKGTPVSEFGATHHILPPELFFDTNKP